MSEEEDNYFLADLEDCRVEVKLFAIAMEETLKKHDKRKLGKEEWKKRRMTWLYAKLIGEVAALGEEIDKKSQSRIFEEAIDIANFAMMIADNSSYLME